MQKIRRALEKVAKNFKSQNMNALKVNEMFRMTHTDCSGSHTSAAAYWYLISPSIGNSSALMSLRIQLKTLKLKSNLNFKSAASDIALQVIACVI